MKRNIIYTVVILVTIALTGCINYHRETPKPGWVDWNKYYEPEFKAGDKVYYNEIPGWYWPENIERELKKYAPSYSDSYYDMIRSTFYKEALYVGVEKHKIFGQVMVVTLKDTDRWSDKVYHIYRFAPIKIIPELRVVIVDWHKTIQLNINE